jgi:hypothetical protein
MWLPLLLSSIVVAGAVAWLITRRVGPAGWPVVAVILQLALPFLWGGVLAGYTDLSDEAALPLASGLGVLTIAVMSAGLWLARRNRRPRDEGYGVVAAEPEPPPELPRARVVSRGRRGGCTS